jgi:hypothetical protein
MFGTKRKAIEMMDAQTRFRAGWLRVALCVGATSLVGCGGSGFPVGQASGTVTCEGKAVPGAWVYFEPLAESKGTALVGKQGFAIADANGKFVIATYGTDDGAVVGKHKVHVTAPKGEGVPAFKCPCEFDSASEPFLVEVKAGKNEFDLKLPLPKAGSNANNKPMSLDERDALREAKQAELEEKANAKANAQPSKK